MAFNAGCKGITVYRDKSRAAPLEAKEEGYLSECENGKCSI